MGGEAGVGDGYNQCIYMFVLIEAVVTTNFFMLRSRCRVVRLICSSPVRKHRMVYYRHIT